MFDRKKLIIILGVIYFYVYLLFDLQSFKLRIDEILLYFHRDFQMFD